MKNGVGDFLIIHLRNLSKTIMGLTGSHLEILRIINAGEERLVTFMKLIR